MKEIRRKEKYNCAGPIGLLKPSACVSWSGKIEGFVRKQNLAGLGYEDL